MILGDSIFVDIAECVKNCDVWKMHLGIWSEERTPGNACRGGISDQSATFLDAPESFILATQVGVSLLSSQAVYRG